MAKLNTAIAFSDIDMEDEYKPIPEGDYTVIAQEAEIRDTNARTGQYINLKLAVTGPTHAGAIVWSMINFINQNEQTRTIGRRQLGHLMEAIGVEMLEDTDQLIGKPFGVHVEIQPAHDGYKARNNVTKFFKADGPVAVAPSSPAPEKPSRRPW